MCGRRADLSDSSPLWRIDWSNCSRTAFEKLALILCQSRRESMDIRGMSSRESASSIVVVVDASTPYFAHFKLQRVHLQYEFDILCPGMRVLCMATTDT